MIRLTILIGLICIITSCGCEFDKEDLLFSESELEHFSSFQADDTIVYSSDHGEHDTIIILEITTHDTNPDVNCGGIMAPRPENNKSVSIEHFPVDQWAGTTQNNGEITKINHQQILMLSKLPDISETTLFISFQNFHGSTNNLESSKIERDTMINGIRFEHYYKFEHDYPERVKDSSDISMVIWTEKEGLTAYQNLAGHFFVKN